MSKQLEEMQSEELWQLFPVALSEPRDCWRQWYREEAETIRRVLGERNVVRLRHIGSTAVPGLPAKPTVDMLLEIREGMPLDTLTETLAGCGYLASPQPENPPPGLMFLKGYTPQGFAERVFHLHVRYPGDPDELYFRDYLREHPEAAARYAGAKGELAGRFRHDRDGYTEAKTATVRDITAQARGEYGPRHDNSGALDAYAWMDALTAGLREAFGDRLLYVGLQGSYRRGEAGPRSDIDAVVILDHLTDGDLRAYRALVTTMPRSELACGFVGGRAELAVWPRQELLQFARETVGFHGSLEGLLPPLSWRDIAEGARTGAAGVYHGACHLRVYGNEADWPAALRALYKSAFFVLQALHLLRTGTLLFRREELWGALEGGEQHILDAALPRAAAPASGELQRDFTRLIDWSAGVLRELAAQPYSDRT